MKIPRKWLYTVALVSLLPVWSFAQNKYTVEFNEKGQIIYNLPSLVTTDDKISFLVRGNSGQYEQRVLAAYMRYLETINNLQAKDDNTNDYKVLTAAGLEKKPDAILYLTQVQAAMAKQLLKMLMNPAYRAIIAKTRDPEQDKTHLETYLVGPGTNEDPTALRIPQAEKLIDPNYVVNVSFSGGYNINKPKMDYPCPATIPLTKSSKQECCLFQWSSGDKTVDFKKYPFTGPFSHFYELRLQNNIFANFSRQVDSLKSDQQFIHDPDIDALQKQFQAAINTLKTDPPNTPLFTWMDDKLAGETKDPFNAAVDTVMTRKVYNALADIQKTVLKDLIDPKSIHFLLRLSWLTHGANLTANPLKNGLITDFKGQLDEDNKQLAVVTQSLSDMDKKLALVENVSKAGTASCCDTGYVNKLVKSYGDLQSARVVIAAKQAKLQETIAGLKKQQSQNDLSLQDDKTTILTDSLLYSGRFIVNNPDCGVWSPNHPNFRYMRNHDALQDLHSADLHIKKEINESQQMEILVINSNLKTSYALSTKYTDISTDLDFVESGVEAAKNAGGAPGGGAPVRSPAPKPVSPDDVLALYTDLHNLFVPYQNGLLATPLLENTDKTPDYMTKLQNHQEAQTAPQTVSYAIVDSASGKNLNTEGASFGYRFNKLYRFRLKAGIAYSWLQRRTYTINSTTNTATYADAYAGLAPAFGVQIFTTRLDIQKEHLFPTTIYPFFYIGYMFHDSPANNFLLGGGFEVFSGFAVAGGIHLGKTQGLSVSNGALEEKDLYKIAPFVSVSIGLEAFNALFNTAKPTVNPLK